MKSFLQSKILLIKNKFNEYYTPSQRKLLFFAGVVFLNLAFFLYLSDSNPWKFLSPHRIYPVSLWNQPEEITYYSYRKDDFALLSLKTEVVLTSQIENDVLFLAQLVQQPKFFLRGNLQETEETFYFPNFSLGILHVHRDDQRLFIYFDINKLKKYPYQKKMKEDELMDLLTKYQKAFLMTIFDHYPDIQSIYWIEEGRSKLFRR
ncbi:MAG: hypothetical protein NZ853_04255 [Leptospiraceae bacterium]|nr:hypothetical protein [Leptospiraceae bacterium]MDW7975386.1 hypothetical protein [Leptospiraceae bacterium]